MTTYSIVIPAYNEGDYLLATVDGILSTCRGKDTEIIIVDDGSDDDAPEQAARKFNARLVRHTTRHGVAHARAAGADAATGTWIVSIDAHTKFPQDWQQSFEQVVHTHFGNGYGYMFGPVIEYGPHTLAGVRFYGDNMDVVAHTIRRRPYQHAMMLSGACQILRRDYYHAIGGFDTGLHFPGRSEDIELSLRVWMTGGKCIALTDITLWTLYRDASYERLHKDEICNAFRIYTLYCSSDKLASIIKARKDEYGFCDGLAMLITSDVMPRRQKLAPRFTRTFNRLVQLFEEEDPC